VLIYLDTNIVIYAVENPAVFVALPRSDHRAAGVKQMYGVPFSEAADSLGAEGD